MRRPKEQAGPVAGRVVAAAASGLLDRGNGRLDALDFWRRGITVGVRRGRARPAAAVDAVDAVEDVDVVERMVMGWR
jgi:hypothetical protein